MRSGSAGNALSSQFFFGGEDAPPVLDKKDPPELALIPEAEAKSGFVQLKNRMRVPVHFAIQEQLARHPQPDHDKLGGMIGCLKLHNDGLPVAKDVHNPGVDVSFKGSFQKRAKVSRGPKFYGENPVMQDVSAQATHNCFGFG